MKIKFSYVDGGCHPVLGQVYHWKIRATEGAEVDRYNRYLCGVLSSVAQGADACNKLLKDIKDVEIGICKEIETGGNDVTLTISQAGMQVDIEINEDWIGQPEAKFKLSEWTIALEAWREFLEMPQSINSEVETEL